VSIDPWVQTLQSAGFKIPDHFIEDAEWVAQDLGQPYVLKLAAVYCALEIRQYSFDGHDDAFLEFDSHVTEGEGTTAEVKAWIDSHPAAVAWALEFSGIQV